MKQQLTAEELKNVYTLANEMQKESQSTQSLEQNMQMSLSSRVEGMDTAAVVSDLCDGIREFDCTLQAAETTDVKEIIQEKLNAVLQGKDNMEQANILTGILNAFANQSPMEADAPQFQFTMGQEVTDEELKQLKTSVVTYIDQFALINMCDDTAETMNQLLGQDVSGQLQTLTWNEEAKYYVALATYLLQVQGNLDSIPSDMGAKEIGISTAAAIAADSAVHDHASGKKNWETVLNVLKIIAAVALTLLAVVVVAKLAAVAALIAYVLAESVIGLGIIGTIAALGFSAWCIWKIVNASSGLICSIPEHVEVVIQKVVECYQKV